MWEGPVVQAAMTAEYVTYIDCPKCGGRVPEPFVRGTLVPYTHTSSSSQRCRFWVHVSATSGDHVFRVLSEAPTETFEGALEDIYEDHREDVDRAVLLSKAREVAS